MSQLFPLLVVISPFHTWYSFSRSNTEWCSRGKKQMLL